MPGICGRCGNKVYAAEERLGLNKSWHIRCFTCASCNRSLDSFTLAENRECDEIYCKVCYRKRFATKGYGYGPNEPTLMSTLPSSNFSQEEWKEIRETETYNTHFLLPTSSQIKCPSGNLSGMQISAAHSLQVASSSPLKNSWEKWGKIKLELKPSWTGEAKCVSNKIQTKTPRKSPSKAVETTLKEGKSNCISGPSQQQSAKALRPQVVSEVKLAVAVKTPSSGLGLQRDRMSRKKLKSGWRGLGGGEPCKRCQRPVYWAEMKLGRCGAYHQECFSCSSCGKALESTTVSENGGEIFCKGCYRRFFATHGCGYGLGAGALQTP